MEALNPVFLRLLVNCCDVSKMRADASNMEVAPQFTLIEEDFLQESAVFLSAIRDIEGARRFGFQTRKIFGANSRSDLIAAQAAAFVYDPDLYESIAFDDAYKAGWLDAHHECLALDQKEKTNAFIKSMSELSLNPGDPVSVMMPSGVQHGVVVYVHPLLHAVAIELDMDTRHEYPLVLMLGAYHDVYPINRYSAV